jgi:hypothetical protein
MMLRVLQQRNTHTMVGSPLKNKRRDFALPTKSLSTKRQKAFLHAVTLFETLHSASGVDQLLLAGEERMAGGTDLRINFRLGGTSLENVTAETLNGHVGVLGVDTFFHITASYRYGNCQSLRSYRKNKS